MYVYVHIYTHTYVYIPYVFHTVATKVLILSFPPFVHVILRALCRQFGYEIMARGRGSGRGQGRGRMLRRVRPAPAERERVREVAPRRAHGAAAKTAPGPKQVRKRRRSEDAAAEAAAPDKRRRFRQKACTVEGIY